MAHHQVALGRSPSRGQEVPVPAFDHGNVKASYVVSLPPGYDPSRRWPLILDFHGAISPAAKGAVLTKERTWSTFVEQVPYIVVGINSRTRAWNMVRGEKDDRAYALHVLEEVKRDYSIDSARMYLAGFSSGSDFLCAGELQPGSPFAGSLPICPGPPWVVGLASGALERKKDHPFYFVTGEEDYIRKDGAWKAFLALDRPGARVLYREVPGLDHRHPPPEECARSFHELEILAGRKREQDPVAAARDAISRGDFLLASTLLLRADGDGARGSPATRRSGAKGLTSTRTASTPRTRRAA